MKKEKKDKMKTTEALRRYLSMRASVHQAMDDAVAIVTGRAGGSENLHGDVRDDCVAALKHLAELAELVDYTEDLSGEAE